MDRQPVARTKPRCDATGTMISRYSQPWQIQWEWTETPEVCMDSRNSCQHFQKGDAGTYPQMPYLYPLSSNLNESTKCYLSTAKTYNESQLLRCAWSGRVTYRMLISMVSDIQSIVLEHGEYSSAKTPSYVPTFEWLHIAARVKRRTTPMFSGEPTSCTVASRYSHHFLCSRI